jgi:hypothetical protein
MEERDHEEQDRDPKEQLPESTDSHAAPLVQPTFRAAHLIGMGVAAVLILVSAMWRCG